MGNNKNKKDLRNNHRHVYKKKKLPCRIGKKQSETGRAESEVNIEGCRIINMDRLQEYTDNLTEHSRTCTRLSSRMFLDGAMPSRSSSVPIMHASATEVHSSASSRTTPPIGVVAVSQQR